MSHSSVTRATAFCAALAFATSGRAQEPIPLPLPVPPAKPDKAEPPESRVTVLERGPIHEGFAQPGAAVRGKRLTAPKAPLAPVDEVPPSTKPEGAGVRWVPGYWQWDADRNDFIWVCGCYRNAPTERTWEPGHWKQVSKEWTYFPGYWRPTDVKALPANLPEPPEPKDEAPTAPKENPNAMWVPGLWQHKNGKFEWQPGYWPPSFGKLIWQQAQYVATETGFAFVPGHWDYPLEERGVLYSPVFFSRSQREKRGWSYRPEHTISFGSASKWGQGGAFDSLSIEPNHNSYFYGDRSTTAGLLPGAGTPGDYQPWDSVSSGYTNPLRQHYTRLNSSDSGLAKGTPQPDATRAARGGSGNALAFVEGGGPCAASGCAIAPPLATKATVGYQHVSPRGSVTTGTMSFRGIAPPVYLGGWYRR